jgi:hypothetical protein
MSEKADTLPAEILYLFTIELTEPLLERCQGNLGPFWRDCYDDGAAQSVAGHCALVLLLPLLSRSHVPVPRTVFVDGGAPAGLEYVSGRTARHLCVSTGWRNGWAVPHGTLRIQ